MLQNKTSKTVQCRPEQICVWVERDLGKLAHQRIRQLSLNWYAGEQWKRNSGVVSIFSIRLCQVCSRVLLWRGCFPYWFSCRAVWLQKRQQMDTNRRNKWQQKCSNLIERRRKWKSTRFWKCILFRKNTRKGIDKKPTEWMTKTCKGILEVNEDTEMPDTFTSGGCSRGERAHFREQPGINHTAKC